MIMPVGAGQLELMPQQLTGGAGSSSIQIVIGGEKWVAGVELDRLQGWEPGNLLVFERVQNDAPDPKRI
ncbi:hypothetical protein [Xenorhabdus bovienii]